MKLYKVSINNEARIQIVQSLSVRTGDLVSHNEYSEVRYNYRMSNLFTSISQGQLEVLKRSCTTPCYL